MTKYFTLILSAAFLFILFALPSCLKDTSLDTTIPPEPPLFTKKMIWKEVAKKTSSSHWKKISDGDILTLRLNPIPNATGNAYNGMYGMYSYSSTNLGADLDSIGGVSITGLNFNNPVLFTSADTSQLVFINIDEEKSKTQDSIIKDTIGIFRYTEIEDTLFLRDMLQTPHIEMKYVKVE